MNTMTIIGIVVLVALIGLIIVMAIGGVVAFAFGGKRRSTPAPTNPFFAQFESALQTVNADARQRAQQYDLAQQQQLYETVMKHGATK